MYNFYLFRRHLDLKVLHAHNWPQKSTDISIDGCTHVSNVNQVRFTYYRIKLNIAKKIKWIKMFDVAQNCIFKSETPLWLSCCIE